MKSVYLGSQQKVFPTPRPGDLPYVFGPGVEVINAPGVYTSLTGKIKSVFVILNEVTLQIISDSHALIIAFEKND